LIVSSFVLGQGSVSGKVDLMDRQINPASIVDELPPPPGGVEGSVHLDDEWSPGKLYMTSNMIVNGYPLRLNIYRNHVEIKDGEVVKVCPYHLIERFILYQPDMLDSTSFMKAEKFRFPDGVPLTGFFEFEYQGRYSLVSFHEIEIKKPDYVEAFDMGNRDHKLVKVTRQYLLKDMAVLCEFKRKVKQMENCLPGSADIHESFLSEQGLKLKREEDKIRFLQYLNKHY